MHLAARRAAEFGVEIDGPVRFRLGRVRGGGLEVAGADARTGSLAVVVRPRGCLAVTSSVSACPACGDWAFSAKSPATAPEPIQAAVTIA